MDIKATLRLTLSNKKDSFALAGSCICCGKPSEDVWTYNKKYNLERWVASSGGSTGDIKPVKQGYKDANGTPAQGEVEIKLPYCSTHLNQTKRLQNYHSRQQNALIIVGVVAAVLYFILVGGKWIGDADTTIQVGFRACGMPIIVFLGAAGLGLLATTAINSGIASKPEYVDYPIDSGSGGGSGLAIVVDSDQNGVIGQPVRYFLNLDFNNIDAAKQFKASYPGTIILLGQELMA